MFVKIIIESAVPYGPPYVTNTSFSRILNKNWAQNEGDARLFDCVVNVLFFFH